MALPTRFSQHGSPNAAFPARFSQHGSPSAALPALLFSRGEQCGPLLGPGIWGHLPQSIRQQQQNESLAVSQSCDLSLTVIQANEIITPTITLSRHIWANTLITQLLWVIFAFSPQAHESQGYITRGILFQLCPLDLLRKGEVDQQNIWVCTPNCASHFWAFLHSSFRQTFNLFAWGKAVLEFVFLNNSMCGCFS